MSQEPEIGFWLDGHCLDGIVRAVDAVFDRHRSRKKPCESAEEKQNAETQAA